MGELCRKFGEKLLTEILTILHTNSLSNDDRTREGVCMALNEILSVPFSSHFPQSNIGLAGRALRRVSEKDMKMSLYQ